MSRCGCRVANPLNELGRAVGRDSAPALTVLDLLQQFAAHELARRGYPVVSVDAVRAAVPTAPSSAESALALARAGGLGGPLMLGRLTRFTQSANDLVLVRLELSLVDPASGAVVWQGVARGPSR